MKSQGGVVSSLVCQAARQSVRQNDASGGIAFIATWLTAYCDSSLTVRQPPR